MCEFSVLSKLLKNDYLRVKSEIITIIANKLHVDVNINNLVKNIISKETKYIDNLKNELINKLIKKQQINIGLYKTFDEYLETKKNIKHYYLNIFSLMLDDGKYKGNFKSIMNHSDKQMLDIINDCERVLADENVIMTTSGRKCPIVYYNFSYTYINALVKVFDEQREIIISAIEDTIINDAEKIHNNPEINSLVNKNNKLDEFLNIVS